MSTGNYKVDIVTQMTTLAISSFALAAGLAWNSLIKTFIEKYLKTWLPEMSEILSMFIYAILITVLAVIVTINLTLLKDDIINTPSVPLQ